MDHMGEIINLNRARKAKARAEATKAADARRADHARTKAQKKLDRARTEKSKADLDAHKLDRD
jgi:hypothetical protein